MNGSIMQTFLNHCVYVGLLEVYESYTNQLASRLFSCQNHPPKSGVSFSMEILSFFFFFFPQILLPSASSCFEQMALSRFRWVFVYTLPTHEADFALHKTVSHHQSSVNGQDRAVVLHPWEPNLAIISTHPEQP